MFAVSTQGVLIGKYSKLTVSKVEVRKSDKLLQRFEFTNKLSLNIFSVMWIRVSGFDNTWNESSEYH